MKNLQISKELLDEARIPEKFWSYGASTFCGAPNALELVNEYILHCRIARQNGIGIFLYGCPQTFKTFLGTYILKCILLRGFTVRYTTLTDISQERFREGETRHTLRQLYGDVDFVFIDDLAEVPHKGELNSLEGVLRIRSTSGLPTILAATFPLANTASLYNDVVARHLNNVREIATDTETASYSVHRMTEEAKAKVWRHRA